MRPMSECPDASMSMAAEEELVSALRKTLADEKITHVVETGTFCGLGSTRIVAEAFAAGSAPETFVTIEVNWESWRKAKSNLARFGFVKPLWGRTVELQSALRFLDADPALRDHRENTVVFIDDTEDPVRFYRNEVRGALGGVPVRPADRIRQRFDRAFSYAGDDLLESYLRAFQTKNPLVILDSAGGLGWLEFQIMTGVMKGRPYLVLLDDVNHLKHFRSCEHVKRDPAFTLVAEDEKGRWLLAKHMPRTEDRSRNP